MKQTTKQHKITQRQTEILTLLYRFRFLNRTQIQTMLKHKSKSLIIDWLNELVNEEIIRKEYDKKLAALPTVYSLDTPSRKYLKDNPDVETKLLNRVWREKNYTKEFQEHCLFLADIFLSLEALVDKVKVELHFYTKTDLFEMEGLIVPAPDSYFAIKQKDGSIKRYFLEIFDDLPPKILRRRVNHYLKYFDSDEWQDNTDKPFPDIILVCPNNRMKNHLKYFIQAKLDEDWELTIYLTTKELIETRGLIREVLEEVVI